MTQHYGATGAKYETRGELRRGQSHSIRNRAYAIFSERMVGIVLVPICDCTLSGGDSEPGAPHHHGDCKMKSENGFPCATDAAYESNGVRGNDLVNKPFNGARCSGIEESSTIPVDQRFPLGGVALTPKVI